MNWIAQILAGHVPADSVASPCHYCPYSWSQFPHCLPFFSGIPLSLTLYPLRVSNSIGGELTFIIKLCLYRTITVVFCSELHCTVYVCPLLWCCFYCTILSYLVLCYLARIGFNTHGIHCSAHLAWPPHSTTMSTTYTLVVTWLTSSWCWIN